MNIVSVFESSARKYPDKAFLRYQGQSHSYADVPSQSRQAAGVLVSRGVRAGDAVAIMCYNTPGFVLALLGAWRLNAVVVPVNHKLQPPEVAYMLRHAGVRVCIFRRRPGPRRRHRHRTGRRRHQGAQHGFLARRLRFLRHVAGRRAADR